MKGTFRMVSAVLPLLFLLLCGCGTEDLYEEEMSALTLGAVLKTMDAEHWMEIRSGMEHAASERDIRLVLQYPSSELAVEEQKLILKDMLAEPLDALLFAPCDSSDTAWLAEAAEAAGLPLFTVDTGATDTRLPYIGSDNRAIGYMAYEYLLETLGAGQKIGIISGTSLQNSLSDRMSSLRFYCTRDGMLDVSSADANCNSYAEAYHAAYRQIQEEGVSAIFCTSGVLGMGAVSAREELGRSDVLLVAVDTQDDVVNAVREGRLDALITQSGYDVGYQAVAWVCDNLAGRPSPSDRYTENTLLTRETIDGFILTAAGKEMAGSE